jgi:hypothetical protein
MLSLQVEPIEQDQVSLVERLKITGGRLVGVWVASARDENCQIDVFAADAGRNIGDDAGEGDHLQWIPIRAGRF